MDNSRSDKAEVWRKAAASATAAADRISFEVTAVILVLSIAFILFTMADIFEFRARGYKSVRYNSLEELKMINPDIVAWISLQGTHVNGPVVRGKDNSEYLDLDFNRRYYAGGTLFLDHRNRRDFSDRFSIIHGHHMAGGSMFGDLYKFKSRKFFSKYGEGRLITFGGEYRLVVIAAGTVNAYDPKAYDIKADIGTHIKVISRTAEMSRSGWQDGIKDARLLMLSTCTGDLSDDRTIVFCLMMEEKE